MKKLLFLLLITMLASVSFAQLASEYSFAYSAGTYTEVTGGTVLGTTSNDDQRFVDPAVPAGGTTTTGVGFPIGFSFTYLGVAFDRVAINANGWISLGQSALTPAVNNASTSGYTPIGSTTAITPTQLVSRIAACGRDLQGQTGSELMIASVGSAPNRELVIQWKNYRKYNATGDNINFQIRLQENGNKVVMVYGAMTLNTTSTTVQVGLRGEPATTATNYKNITSTTSWSAPTAGATNAAAMTLSNTVYPASGTTYTWAPPVAGLPPNPAAIVSPANGATQVLPTATLNWASGGGMPTGYKMYFADFNPPTAFTDLGNVTTYNPGTLQMNHTYYWKVVPYNAIGDAVDCPVWSFTTHNGQVALTAPANAAIDQNITNLAFSWGTAPGAESYKIKIGTSSGSGNVVDMLTTTSPYTLVGPLAYSTTYYWSVYSVYPSRVDIQSPEWTFTTKADPTVSSFPWLADFGTTGAIFPPLNWTKYDGLLANPSVLTAGSGSWVQENYLYTAQTPVNFAARLNIWSTTTKSWLMTPPINVPTDGNTYKVSFDFGLCAYATANPPATTGTDDKFIVLYGDGTSWTPANVLRQWDNAGSAYVYNNIPNTGTNAIIELPSTGVKYIAFYGESTLSNADNNLYVDNVKVYTGTFDDYAITALTATPLYKFSGSPVTFNFTVKNNGEVTTGKTVTFTDPVLGTLGTVSVGTLATGASANLSFLYTFGGAGSYNVTAAVNADGIPANDSRTLNNLGVWSAGQLAEGFEDVAFPPSRWQTNFDPLYNGWTRNSTALYCYDGVGSAQLVISNVNNHANLLTPELEFTGTASPVELWIRSSIASMGTVEVRITDGTTSTLLTTVTPTTTYTQIVPNMTGITGRYRISIEPLATATGTLYVDRVIGPFIYVPVEVPGPVTLQTPVTGTTGVNPLTAQLTWLPPSTGGLPTAYTIFVSNDADWMYEPNPENPDGVVYAWEIDDAFTSFTPYTYDGTVLDYNTRWYWTVLAANETGPSTDPGAIYFNTMAQMSAPATLDLGNVWPGAVKNGTIAVVNNGPTPLTFDASGADFAFGARFSVPASSTYNLPYAFTAPGTVGAYAGTITLTETSPGGSVSTITVSGAISTEIAFGTGTANLYLPVYPWYGYTYSQVIYPASWFSYPDGYRIEKIYYYYNSATAPTNTAAFKVWMGHTAQSDMSTAANIPVSGQTLVFDGTWTITAGVGWKELVLQTPFIYNRTDNLVVTMDENTPGYTANSTDWFACTALAPSPGASYYNDTTNPDPDNLTATPIASRGGYPNTKFFVAEIPAAPIFGVTPTSKTFPATIINTTASQSFAITNSGAGSISVTDITIAGSGFYTLTGLPTFPAEVTTNTVNFGVQYAPTAVGTHTATATIYYNDGAAQTFDIPIDGSCFDPTVATFPYTEDFELSGADVLPTGWDRSTESSSAAAGWHFGTNLSSSYWTIPAHTVYAASNDDAANSNCNMDLLFTPPFNFVGQTGVPIMNFDAFYTAAYGQLAYVEVSTNGVDWTNVFDVPSDPAWATYSVGLGDYMGLSPVYIRFHADDAGQWASGFAIDNFSLIFSTVDTFAPVIDHYPVIGWPFPGTPIDIAADVYDNPTLESGIASVSLTYVVDGGAPATVPMALGTGGYYEGQIPGQAAGSTVAYYLTAVDSAPGANTTNSNTWDFSVNTPVVLQYDNNPGTWDNLGLSSGTFGILTGFTNPFGANPCQINSVTGGLFNAGDATVHVYTYADGVFTDVIPPFVQTFVANTFTTIPLTGCVTSAPVFYVGYTDIVGPNYFLRDASATDYPNTHYIHFGAGMDAANLDTIEGQGFAGVWGIRAEVQAGAASLDAPVVAIANLGGGALMLDWDDVPGAASYVVESSASPNEGWAPLASVGVSQYEIAAPGTSEFYHVIASSSAATRAVSNVVSVNQKPSFKVRNVRRFIRPSVAVTSSRK